MAEVRPAILVAAAALAGVLPMVMLSSLALAQQDEAAPVVERYNSRDLGGVAWRRVRLDLFDKERRVKSFLIVNAWRRTGSGAETVFLLEQPEALKDTAYVLQEGVATNPPEDMIVQVFIPAGRRRVLRVNPGLLDQGLLGADFSYRDMRQLLPSSAVAHARPGRGTCLGEPCFLLELGPLGQWSSVQVHLGASGELIYGIDYFEAGRGVPTKTVRVVATEQIDGILTATKMVAVEDDGRRSLLSLLDFEPHSKRVQPAAFDAASLPRLRELILPATSTRHEELEE